MEKERIKYADIERNIMIYRENQKIISENAYEFHGKRISLNSSKQEHCSVVVLTPEKIKEIESENIPCVSKCEIQVRNEDSFQAPTDFVMNFANAVHPGGGYIYGAVAQEECLCRESTLYASISSKSAEEMYYANIINSNVFDTDYMLLSPHVDVFRNVFMELLPTPYTVAVLTIAAPNLHGKAGVVGQTEMDCYMKRRIRQCLKCGAYYGYKTAALGAWGCGAFGHDARRAAEYFRCVLIDEGYQNYYDKIVFSVYDNTPEQYNYRCFKEAFNMQHH